MAGESPSEIAEALGRTTRWVRKWVARHSEEGHVDVWAEGHSRMPHHSPNRTSVELQDLIEVSRARLVANPRAQYGSLVIQWELARLGIVAIPTAWTIERVLAHAGVTRPRLRQAGYVV